MSRHGHLNGEADTALKYSGSSMTWYRISRNHNAVVMVGLWKRLVRKGRFFKHENLAFTAALCGYGLNAAIALP